MERKEDEARAEGLTFRGSSHLSGVWRCGLGEERVKRKAGALQVCW